MCVCVCVFKALHSGVGVLVFCLGCSVVYQFGCVDLYVILLFVGGGIVGALVRFLVGLMIVMMTCDVNDDVSRHWR